ncbi:hypothetical protein ABFZ85_08660 [Hyphococcus formosus]|uniref:hypothetical protein n=1 Tax=Hyphococcus formosus TaxID=3143534 RepID=UPI00398B4392
MRSLPELKTRIDVRFVVAAFAAITLSGCLVSEEPILTEKNGKARPLKAGGYQSCAIADDGSLEDCEPLTVTTTDDRGYMVASDEQEPTALRFRRVKRKSYVAQMQESDGYAYYYAAGDRNRLTLTMMECPDLPEDLRSTLIENGDLASDDADYEFCTVLTIKGLTEAGRAYATGKVANDSPLSLVLTAQE